MKTRRIWSDVDGKLALWQRPNIWLIIWALSELVRLVLRHGSVMQAVRWVGTAALMVWALLEIFQGVNYFRRALGLVVLLISAASLFRLAS